MFIKDYKEQYIQNLKLAAPVMLSQVGQIFVQLADNAMVGALGALPLAAVSFGGTVFFIMFIFCIGVSLGLTPLVGEMYAQGRHRTSGVYLQNSILLYGIIGVLSMGLMYATMPLLYRMGQPIEVVDMALPYYKYLAWSVIPVMIFASFKQFLEGVGNTVSNMVIIVVANLINIFFNFMLIYGYWGFPEMGAAGAGLSTFISRALMPLMIIGYFLIKPKYKRYFKYFAWNNFNLKTIKVLFMIGSPIALQMIMEGGAFAATTFMMGWIGMIEMAANQIATIISNIAFMMVLGVGTATTIMVSHAYGRGNLQDLKRAANASYHLSFAWNTVSATLIILFRKYIPGLFISDPEVIEIASHLLIFVAAFQFFDGVQAMTIGILRGMQDVKSIMVIAFFAYIVINIPISYFFAFVLGLGPGGIWMGFMFGLGIAAVLLFRRSKKTYNKLYASQNQSAA